MRAGNKIYNDSNDIPAVVPVFPLAGALLLPGSQLPLNLFEPRYLSMFDAALASHRIIAMVQPAFDGDIGRPDKPNLCKIGCLGRIVSFAETGDGRYMINLNGICRFRIIEELDTTTLFRQCRVTPFAADLNNSDDGSDVDREELLGAFSSYLKANDLEADWESVEKAPNLGLVNALCAMAPYGPAEKQAILEAPDVKSRAQTLVAITEMSLAREDGEFRRTIQ